MSLFRPVTLLCALALSLMPLQARALDAPQQAIGADTLAVVWLDFEQLNTDAIRAGGQGLASLMDGVGLAELGLAVPLGDPGESAEQLASFGEGFVEAGGEGLLVVLGMPGEENWSPTMSMYAKVSDNPNPLAMATLIGEMSDTGRTAEITGLGQGWHQIELSAADGTAITSGLPEEADEQAYEALTRQLGDVEDPGFGIVFNVDSTMMQMISGIVGLAAPDANANQDPQAAMLAAIMQPLGDMQSLGLAFSFGEGDDESSLAVDVQMSFGSQEQADLFANTFNTAMRVMPVLLFQQTQNVEGAPEPTAITRFFTLLTMTNDQGLLKLRLDDEFFDLFDEVGPFLEGLMGQGLGPGQLGAATPRTR